MRVYVAFENYYDEDTNSRKLRLCKVFISEADAQRWVWSRGPSRAYDCIRFFKETDQE